VVVIYDASNKLDVLSTPDGTSLQLQQSIECPVQPLSVKFITNERLLVLMREPEYLKEYKLSDNETFVIDSAAATTRALQQVATSSNIVMPTSIMEVDKKSGQVKMQKEAESRGGGNDAKPWNKVERIQTAKEATRRRDKRRRLEREENEVKASED
jgi:type IV secretory pathway TrbF-like protein